MARKRLRCFYQNTRGLRTKIAKGLRNTITLANHELVGLTETWLCDRFSSESIFDESYVTYRSDRTNRTYLGANRSSGDDTELLGGGALIAIKKNISAVRISEWETEVPFDNVWIKINTTSSKKILVNCIYISPSTKFDTFNVYLKQLLDIINVREPNAHIIVMGDFNRSNIEWYWDGNGCYAINPDGRYANELVDTLVATNLTQINFVKNEYNRILDLVITNMSNIGIKRGNAIVGADKYHPPLIFYVDPKEICLMRGVKTPKFNFFRADYTSINQELDKLNWQTLFSNCSVDEAVQKFYGIVQTLICKFVPKTKLNSHSFPKWFSKELIQMIYEKEYYHKMMKTTNNPIIKQLFDSKRKQIKKERKQSLWKYENNIETLLKTNPRCFFSYTKSLQKSNHLPAIMRFKTRTAENMKATTNLFAEYFSSVYTTNNTTNDVVCNNNCDNYFDFSELDIINIINKMDKNKSSSPDGIPIIFYKNTIQSIIKPLVLIFKSSISQMKYPETFKISHITPIHKAGNIDNVENYRPISIISTISKIFDKLLFRHLLSRVSHLISPLQHGFTAGKSTETNLIEYVEYLIENMKNGGQVDSIYMDLAKAFDKIDHNILIRKLHSFPISPCLIQLLKTYLENRKQFVCLYGEKSECITPGSSVPQGSVLSPLLFALFINDLPSNIKSKILLFADDVKLFFRIETIADARQLQCDIDTIVSWCHSNGLSLNASKCFLISFTRRRETTFQYFNYNIDGTTILRVNCIKDLGVLFDPKLSFKNHCEHVTKKAYRMLGFISRSLNKFREIRTYQTLYNLYIRSNLEYCSSIWNPHCQDGIDIIERVQKKYTRLIFRKFRYPYESYNMRLIRLEMLSLENRRILSDEQMLYKIKNGRLNLSISHDFQFNPRPLRFNNNRIFYLPFVNNNAQFFGPIIRMHRNHMEIFPNVNLFEQNYASFRRYSLHEIKETLVVTNYQNH